jgi:hypothetical protein
MRVSSRESVASGVPSRSSRNLCISDSLLHETITRLPSARTCVSPPSTPESWPENRCVESTPKSMEVGAAGTGSAVACRTGKPFSLAASRAILASAPGSFSSSM